MNSWHRKLENAFASRINVEVERWAMYCHLWILWEINSWCQNFVGILVDLCWLTRDKPRKTNPYFLLITNWVREIKCSSINKLLPFVCYQLDSNNLNLTLFAPTCHLYCFSYMASRKRSIIPGPSEPALMKERVVPLASKWKKSPYFGRKDPFWGSARSTTSPPPTPRGAPLYLSEDIDSKQETLIPRCCVSKLSKGISLTATLNSKLFPIFPLVGKNGLMISFWTRASVRGFKRPDC